MIRFSGLLSGSKHGRPQGGCKGVLAPLPDLKKCVLADLFGAFWRAGIQDCRGPLRSLGILLVVSATLETLKHLFPYKNSCEQPRNQTGFIQSF